MDFERIIYSINWQTFNPTNWARVGVIIQACLTIFIATAAVYVAYQQHVTNKRQLRLALFEKRLAVYESVMKIKGLVIANARLDLNELFDFIKETRNYEFLFGKGVSDYIDTIYKKGVEVYAQLGHGQVPSEPATVVELLTWFGEQGAVARGMFLKYMDFTEP